MDQPLPDMVFPPVPADFTPAQTQTLSLLHSQLLGLAEALTETSPGLSGISDVYIAMLEITVEEAAAREAVFRGAVGQAMDAAADQHAGLKRFLDRPAWRQRRLALTLDIEPAVNAQRVRL